MRVLFLGLCSLIIFTGFGQNLEQFTFLKSEGVIPDDFLKSATSKYEEDLKANKNENLDKDFFLSTRFFIDELLLSGKILYNEPLSNYVNNVAKYALRTQKKLAKELRFYVLKSNTVNAFSTDQGIIFFTTGLLAQLENEAQLAYILCHEVSHYTEHHVQESYIEKQQIIKGKSKYKNLSYDDRLDEMSIYSKETELEADAKGIDLYLKSQYSVDEIINSFEVLLYAYLPFNDVQFDTNFFTTAAMEIPGVFFPDSIKEITRSEDYDDSGSSHPNIKTRIDKTVDYIGDRSSKGDLKFKIGKEKFEYIRNLARFEGINLKLIDRKYTEAIYTIFLLQKTFPDNQFLQVSLMKCFYGLSKYKNGRRFSEVRTRLKKVEGESYKLHAFIQKLSKGQLNVMAYRFAYDLTQKYPENKFLKKYEVDLKKDLATNKDVDIHKFIDKPFELYVDSLSGVVETFDIEDSIRKIENSDLSKYKKIKLKKKLRLLQNGAELDDENNQFHYYALHDLVANNSFIDELIALKKEEEQEKESTKTVSDNKSVKLGLDSIIIVDPFIVTHGLNGKEKLEKSELKEGDLNDIYLDDYPNLDLSRTLLDSKEFSKLDVGKYNDLGLIYQWIEEVINHEDLGMISSSSDKMEEIVDLYGTSNFLFSGIGLYKSRKEFTTNHFLGILTVYGAPIVLADLLIVHHYIDYSAIVVDAEHDRILYVESMDVNLRGTKNNLNFLVYHVLHSINSKEKSK